MKTKEQLISELPENLRKYVEDFEPFTDIDRANQWLLFYKACRLELIQMIRNNNRQTCRTLATFPTINETHPSMQKDPE